VRLVQAKAQYVRWIELYGGRTPTTIPTPASSGAGGLRRFSARFHPTEVRRTAGRRREVGSTTQRRARGSTTAQCVLYCAEDGQMTSNHGGHPMPEDDGNATVKTVNGRLVVVGTKGGHVRINDGQSIIALSPAAAVALADHLRAAAERLQ
jgi:hypothetical protein